MAVKAFTLHAIQQPREGGGFIVHPARSVIEIDEALFETLSQSGAVRAPRPTEQARAELVTETFHPLDHDQDGRKGGSVPAEAPALVARHKGGGRYVVVNRGGEVVSGDDLFEDRESADEWIAEQVAAAGVAESAV